MKILLLTAAIMSCHFCGVCQGRPFGKLKTAATPKVTEATTVVTSVAISNPSFQKLTVRLPFSNTDQEYWVRKWGHFYILNDDIIVGNDLPKTMSYAINGREYRWSNATLPIVIDPSIYTNNLGNNVHAAIKEFNHRTELCLVPRTTEPDYIRITFSSTIPGGGLSSVGRQGGEQQLFLSANSNAGTVMHELLHAAGFYHEQSRNDRDNFVRIRTDNITTGLENNFQKEMKDGVPVGNYDYCSIMHYSNTAFSKNAQPTIECMSNGMVVACPPCMGNRTTFSDQDVQSIDWFYSSVSRFPCDAVFPNPNYRQPQFPNTSPSASDIAMQTFRFRAQKATEFGFVGAFPNFHEARQGINIVGGTIFLRNGMAFWQDVPIGLFGNVSLSDFGGRMRAAQLFATAYGFVGAFPNFFHTDFGRGIVCGTIMLPATAAEWRDVPLSEMGNPPLDDIGARFRAANDYAVRNGFLGGYPNMFHADYGKGVVCGVILIKKEAGEWRDVVIASGPR
jgi:hypothetical protein